MIETLGIDLETFSSVDIGQCGVHKYVEAPDFDILLFAYSVNGGDVKCVDLACGEKIPKEIMDAIYDENVEKTAFNAAFERTCIGKYFGRYCDPKQWSCSMVLASSCGLPLSLAGVGEAMGLSEDQAKMKAGKELIRYFCIPCKATKSNGMRTRNLPEDAPDKWELFKQYNIRDVEVENTIRKTLLKWRADYSEHIFWCLDQQINDRGIKVDTLLANNAITMGNEYREELLAEAASISGLENPNSSEQIKKWLEEQEGIQVVSLNKKAIAEVVAGLSNEDSKHFMTLRSEFSKASTKKYDAVLRYVAEDGHVHGCFQFDGAGRTGRFAGRGVQLQNLPRNYIKDLDSARDLVLDGDLDTFRVMYPDVQDTLSQLIRTVLIPEDGHQFLVADFSAIEARVIAWIADETWRLDVFRNGGDIYCASASQMFHVPVEKDGQNSELRQKGKIAELALGYGGSSNSLRAFGADKLGMTDEEMAETVEKWREASPRITALWKAMDVAAKQCIRGKRSILSARGHIRFDFENGVMWMTTPSGRRIAYWGADIGEDRWGRPSITYIGQNQTTKKWERIETYGAKLVENLVQATARDCLKEAMLALNKEGFDIRGHVHDEVIITEPIDGRDVKQVCEIMGREIKWAPGLPLKAAGYTCPSYRKD